MKKKLFTIAMNHFTHSVASSKEKQKPDRIKWFHYVRVQKRFFAHILYDASGSLHLISLCLCLAEEEVNEAKQKPMRKCSYLVLIHKAELSRISQCLIHFLYLLYLVSYSHCEGLKFTN